MAVNLEFENKLWEMADKLRGNIQPSDYKDVVLGLIFLKYISDSFEEKYNELVAEGDGFEEDRDAYAEDNIFWVNSGPVKGNFIPHHQLLNFLSGWLSPIKEGFMTLAVVPVVCLYSLHGLSKNTGGEETIFTYTGRSTLLPPGSFVR